MERWNLPSVACQAFGFVSEVSRYVRARGRDLRRRASLDSAKGPGFSESQLRVTGPASGSFFAQRNGGKNGSASGVCDDQHAVMEPRNRESPASCLGCNFHRDATNVFGLARGRQRHADSPFPVVQCSWRNLLRGYCIGGRNLQDFRDAERDLPGPTYCGGICIPNFRSTQ
jgi:hypothetical protein